MVYFLSNERVEGESFIHLKDESDDESLKNIRKYLKEELITVKSKKIDKGIINIPDNVTDIAVPIDEVLSNEQLKMELKENFHEGKKVYFYGNEVKPETVRDILDVDEISVAYEPKSIEGNHTTDENKSKGKMVVKSREEIIKERGPLKSNAPKIDKEEAEYEVIGYTIKDEPNAIVLAHIHSDDNNVTPIMALHTILSREIKELEAKYGITFDLANANLLVSNKAFAESVQVKSYLNGYSATYYNGKLIGDQETSWILYRDKSGDSDPTVDRFSVEDITTITGYNGFKQFYAKVDHDIPLDRDKIYKWGPGDYDGTSGSVTFSIPWGLSLEIPLNNDTFDIDDIGYAPLDYARWELTTDFPNTSLPNPTRFESGTAWFSAQSATFATMDIRHWAYLDDIWGTEKQVYGMFDVDYDY